MTISVVSRPTRPGQYDVALVATTGLVIALAIVLKVLFGSGGDPSSLAAFGEDESLTRTYAEHHLESFIMRPHAGHDGKFFFIQANDPLVLDPEGHASFLDFPRYRSQRMLYPLIAGLGGLLSPTAILWGLIGTNLVAVAIGSAAVAMYAKRYHMTPWLGLAFALNPGVINELGIDGSGVLAFALVCVGVTAVVVDRPTISVGSLALAGLTREVMILAAIGLAIWYLCNRRPRMALAMSIPAIVVGLWSAYLRLRLPNDSAVGVEAFDWPFMGMYRAAQMWLDVPIHMLSGILGILVIGVFVWQIVRGRSDPMAAASVGFVLLAVFLSFRVWYAGFDLTRAVAPVFTAVVLRPRDTTWSRRFADAGFL